MSEVPEDLKYTEDHERVSVENGIATIGITDYAQNALGDLVYVELPEVDESFSKGDSCAVVESVKSASEVYAPLSGTIVEVNSMLEDEPGLVNGTPYEDGWLMKIKLEDKSELEDMLSDSDYIECID
ncbi:MAG: glycine cleavage system protein GcvH [Rickettsiales bacterium]|nr:glycine cleavage system protein GcvH [Rickettsiales bacterium]